MTRDSEFRCSDKEIGDGLKLGPDVLIEAERVRIGQNVSIGSMDDDDSFRLPGGVRVKVHSIELGDNARVSRSVLIKGGEISVGPGVAIEHDCTIDVRKRLLLGASSYLSPYCRLSGRDVSIGPSFRMLTWANIGGGSCFEPQSKLRVGGYCHLGEFAQINTADSVTIGNEVGIGVRSGIFTHGAYQSIIKGYPVSFGPVVIEDNCWLPNAYVLPNVRIGRGTVVAAGSLVNKDLPAYCLAGGIPAKVLKENMYARQLSPDEKIVALREFMQRLDMILVEEFGSHRSDSQAHRFSYRSGQSLFVVNHLNGPELESLGAKAGDAVLAAQVDSDVKATNSSGVCVFDLGVVRIMGPESSFSKRVREQLRRYGVRFY